VLNLHRLFSARSLRRRLPQQRRSGFAEPGDITPDGSRMSHAGARRRQRCRVLSGRGKPTPLPPRARGVSLSQRRPRSRCVGEPPCGAPPFTRPRVVRRRRERRCPPSPSAPPWLSLALDALHLVDPDGRLRALESLTRAAGPEEYDRLDARRAPETEVCGGIISDARAASACGTRWHVSTAWLSRRHSTSSSANPSRSSMTTTLAIAFLPPPPADKQLTSPQRADGLRAAAASRGAQAPARPRPR
jgi:hypothetical protein